ncbi:hypothetical protein [Streptomyces sp. CRB46]|uniref:hypothetical protein n=1 Tax=Streptomyces sp. CRB46 TaxID=2682613 RepID=UPI0018F662BE|nr:hypothetical protein [Streptomyces sp. CRB46]
MTEERNGPGEGHSGERRTDTADRPFLQRPQGIIAVASGGLSFVAGIVALAFLFFPDVQPKPGPPELELVDVDLSKERDIQADWISGGGERETRNWKTSLVTVMLRNSGDNPVAVSHAEFRFRSIDEVGCPYGAGGTEIKARYDIKVPVGTQAPYRTTRKMMYTVPPHEQERIAFSVGPASVFGGSLPMVYTFDVVLHLDDNSKITLPAMTYMAPSGSEEVLAAAEAAMNNEETYGLTTEACVREQERTARKLAQGTAYVSPELRSYSAELTRLVSG